MKKASYLSDAMTPVGTASSPGPSGTTASPHFEIQKLDDGVYAALDSGRGAALCNATLIDLGGSVLVFDPFLTPKAARDLERTSRELFGRSPDLVVNSHAHFDHIRGNQAFPGARIVSTRGTRDLVIERHPPSWDGERREFETELAGLPKSGLGSRDVELWSACCREILESYGELRVLPADVTFETSMTIHGSRRRVDLVSYGAAHSRSDGFLVLPEERIAVLGDLLTVDRHASLHDGDLGGWRSSLDRIRGLGHRRLVPGHGPLAAPEDLDVFRRYVDAVDGIAGDLVAPGVDPDRVEVPPPPPPFDAWWLEQFYRESVRGLLRIRIAAGDREPGVDA